MIFLELCRINAEHLGARWKTASFSLASRAPATDPAILVLSMYLIYELLCKPGLCPNWHIYIYITLDIYVLFSPGARTGLSRRNPKIPLVGLELAERGSPCIYHPTIIWYFMRGRIRQIFIFWYIASPNGYNKNLEHFAQCTSVYGRDTFKC